MSTIPMKQLPNGIAIPQLGFGVFRSPEGSVTAESVRCAVESGYRHIDTAAIYGNEASVGEGIATCGISRDQLFITGKIWNKDMRDGNEEKAFLDTLKKLGTDYLDLYLIHWPVECHTRSWKVLEHLYEQGAVRAIGVSNYHKQHLDALFASADIAPMVNQFECHPYLTQKNLISLSRDKGMLQQSYRPLGGEGAPVLKDPVLLEIAQARGRTPAQIALRWNLQNESAVLVKSNQTDRIRSNLQVFDFTLTQEEMEQINGLNKNWRTGSNPDSFNF